MIDKIKSKIDQNKKDKSTFKEYIKSFCKSEKANEIFENNEEFKRLKDLSTEKEKEEF